MGWYIQCTQPWKKSWSTLNACEFGSKRQISSMIFQICQFVWKTAVSFKLLKVRSSEILYWKPSAHLQWLKKAKDNSGAENTGSKFYLEMLTNLHYFDRSLSLISANLTPVWVT